VRAKIARPLRAYVDTSVFGGVHDEEFQEASVRFFQAVRNGRITIVVSAATAEEIAVAPDEVRATFDVQLRRVHGLHAANIANVYPPVEIRSPPEVV